MSLDPKVGAIYNKWYADNVCRAITYRGIPIIKNVCDLWNYQEIIHIMRPNLIVEFGTGNAGSTLWFADTLEKANPHGLVFTVDVQDWNLKAIKEDSRIRWMLANSASPEVRACVIALRTTYLGPIFVILDSDHGKKHVFAEMEMLRPILKAGDYLVVEDGNINGHPIYVGWGEGPYEALEEYMAKYPNDYELDIYREVKFGWTFNPKGYLKHR